MKILHTVESYLPLRHGMQEVVSRLSEGLVKRGHEVTVATSVHPERDEKVINGVRVEEFALGGNMVNGYRGNEGEIFRYQHFLVESTFDVVVHFAAQQWATDLAFAVLPQMSSKKVLVPTGFSALFLEQYRDYFSRMPEWMQQYDALVFLSDTYRDIRFAREQGIKNFVVIPNGASEEEFLREYPFSIRDRLGIQPDAFLVLLVGSHTGVKGHKEAIEIFDRAEIENATLLIVANQVILSSLEQPLCKKVVARVRTIIHRFRDECPGFCLRAEARYNAMRAWRSEKKRLLIRDLSREETVRAYQEADLFLFPSRIECSPIVLFEAVASRTPFLSTDVGNAAEIAAWTGGGKILPTTHNSQGYAHADIDGSARMLEDLWRDEQTRREMAEKGYVMWRRRFSWEKIVEDYEHLYYRILRGERIGA